MKNHIVVIRKSSSTRPSETGSESEADEPAVVCYLSDSSLIGDLRPNPDEVDAIFSHPLKGCLDGHVSGDDAVGLSDKGGQWWPHEEDFHVS